MARKNELGNVMDILFILVMFFPDKTLPVQIGLENIDSDIKNTDSFHQCKKVFNANIVKTKGGEYNNVRYVEEFENGQIVKRIVLGSVRYDIYCPTQAALDEVWLKYTSGDMHRHYSKSFELTLLKKKFALPNLYLNVLVEKSSTTFVNRKLRGIQVRNHAVTY